MPANAIIAEENPIALALFLPLKIPNGICFTLRNKRESDFLLLGEYKEGELVYAGTVTMGVRREILRLRKKGRCPFQSIGKASEEIVWCRPERVCTVEYMPNTLDALRQQVLRGYRMMWNGSRVYGIKKLPVLVRAAWCCLYCYSFIPKAE